MWKLVLSVLLTSLSLIQHTSSANVENESELILLISLSRHGSRAPNPSVQTHCPNNMRNIKAYSVPLEQLTERGMDQMEKVGDHIRGHYVNETSFLSSTFNGPEKYRHFEGYFRADAANRCGQSAVSLGYGLYPKGTGPHGYSKQPIPVYMQLFENEHDFTANGPCRSVMSSNNLVYTKGRAAAAIKTHKKTLEAVAKICGNQFYTGSDPVTAIKDVSDMFLFDHDEGLTATPGLTPELVKDITNLAFQHLIERLYSTPAQITVAIGGFPQLLVRNLRDAATSTRKPDSPKYLSYHGHRELMHGLGFMMGMKFNFEGLPQFNGSTVLYPASTLFFELRRVEGNYFVQLFVWSPFSDRTAIKLDNCELKCPLDDFIALIENHIQSTGPWQDLCHYHPVNVPTVKTTSFMMKNTQAVESDNTNVLWTMAMAGAFVAVGAVGGTLYQRYMNRHGYQSF